MIFLVVSFLRILSDKNLLFSNELIYSIIFSIYVAKVLLKKLDSSINLVIPKNINIIVIRKKAVRIIILLIFLDISNLEHSLFIIGFKIIEIIYAITNGI